jgi:hypothetical protein
MDCVELCGDNDDLNEMDIFMSTLYGETKVRFEILLDQCTKALQINDKNDERIFELEGHARDYANEIASLTQSLEEEHDLRVALETSKLCLEESHNLDIAKLKSGHDISQSIANELRLQNEKLNLIIVNEATKSLSSTFVASSCSTNPSCEKVPLKGNKKLDELLNAQKKHGDKTGLGYASKSKKNKKKKNKKKKKNSVPAPPPSLKKHASNEIYYDENGNIFEEEVREVIGNAKKAMPNHNNFAGKYNPSYVLCRERDGHVYAKFVGSSNEYVAWSTWVPKTLVTNKKGPIEKWGPKIKT